MNDLHLFINRPVNSKRFVIESKHSVGFILTPVEQATRNEELNHY